tara:strand:+ start:561 stop:1568 length:1008 start_codon:yes stop_codon:yes gene_type:complete
MIKIKENYSLSNLNSFGFNHKAEYFSEVRSVEDCKEYIDFCLKKNLPITILGEGTNVVLTKNIPGAVLKVNIPGKVINGEVIEIGAGEEWNNVVLWSLENKLFGLENLSLIPGTAGAAPVQNIGAYGQELSSVLVSLEAINTITNEIVHFDNKECLFGYRDSLFKKNGSLLICSIKLKLSEEPKTNTNYKSLFNYLLKDDVDPESATPYQVCRAVTSIRTNILPDYKKEPNVGSFYKNLFLTKEEFKLLQGEIPDIPFFKYSNKPIFKVPTAFILEKLGWKGFKDGGVCVSKKHSLVLISKKGASSSELINLSANIIDDVYSKVQIKLEIEPTIL